MGARLIRVTSRALGERRHVIVRVYDTRAEMCAAGTRFNGGDLANSDGITQAYLDDDKRVTVPVVRLTRSRLSTQVISHEMHHAATSLYGSTLNADTLSSAVLTHHNEPFAHLFSDLLTHVIDSLYRFGYYD